MGKRKKRSEGTSPSTSADVYQLTPSESHKLDKEVFDSPMFRVFPVNEDLDINHKMIALKVSPSIVSLVSFSGEVLVSQNSGTIIEVEGNVNTVITSLNLIRRSGKKKKNKMLSNDLKIIVHTYEEKSYIAEILTYDYHYNLLIIKFKSATSLQPANLRMLDDDLGLDTSFQFSPHSSKAKPGDPVLMLGRYFLDSFETMVAPGYFKMDHFNTDKCDCRELLKASCKITDCGDGGAVINLSGELVGIAFYFLISTSSFLPINVAFKWWNHFKTHKESRHPSYGFEAINLYLADLYILERVLKKFPSMSNGVLVEEVQPGSYAETAGLREDDIIIKCDGKTVKSFFKLWDLIWDKVGQVVEFEVLRIGHSNSLSISLSVGEAMEPTQGKEERFSARYFV